MNKNTIVFKTRYRSCITTGCCAVDTLKVLIVLIAERELQQA
jgi:hypothetical protein